MDDTQRASSLAMNCEGNDDHIAQHETRKRATEGINIYEVTVHSSAWQCIGWRATDWCTPVGADQCGKTLSTDASSIRLCNSGGY
eukprot:372963-Pelagomonas_calceolata.AAC.1